MELKLHNVNKTYDGKDILIDINLDLKDESNDVTFIMAKDIYEQTGDIMVELSGGGYMVKPIEQSDSDCGSCAGSCG